MRMNSDLPKVLHPLGEKPLLLHVIDSLKKSGSSRIIAVIGYRGEMVTEAIVNSAETVETVWQHEQLGTGHAVMQAEQALKNYTGPVIVACGDVPLIKPSTFRSLVEDLGDPGVKASVLTMKPDNPYGYGRIVKNSDGVFTGIVEEKDATEAERKINEVNTGTYAFDKEFLFEGLKQIDTDNAQKEYYLPDVFNYIIKTGYRVKTVCLENPIEGSGINSPEELAVLEKYIESGNK